MPRLGEVSWIYANMCCVFSLLPTRSPSVYVKNVHHSEMALLHKLFNGVHCNLFSSNERKTRESEVLSHSLVFSFESRASEKEKIVVLLWKERKKYVDVYCISMSVCM
jgi:hypothetical protein